MIGQIIKKLKHACVSTVPIFKTLKLRELHKLNRLIQKKDYPKGSILFMQGDPTNHLYIVQYGKVKLYEATNDGRQQIVRILEQGDFFGELSLFNDNPVKLNAESLEDTRLCMLPKEEFKDLIKENPEMTLSIMETMSKRLAYAERLIGDLALKNIEERIVSWLLVIAEKDGIDTSQGIKISLDISRQELANLLGTTQETLSRKLTILRSEGIISSKGQKIIIIHDKEKLATLTTRSCSKN